MILDSEKDKLKQFKPVLDELRRAKKKHPYFPEDMFRQVAIINEESGEITKAVLKFFYENGSIDDVKEEIIQTAAMCMRMLNYLNRSDATILKQYSEQYCTCTDEQIPVKWICQKCYKEIDVSPKTDPTICPNCGYKHPLVAEFGYCGSCASKIYGDNPM